MPCWVPSTAVHKLPVEGSTGRKKDYLLQCVITISASCWDQFIKVTHNLHLQQRDSLPTYHRPKETLLCNTQWGLSEQVSSLLLYTGSGSWTAGLQERRQKKWRGVFAGVLSLVTCWKRLWLWRIKQPCNETNPPTSNCQRRSRSPCSITEGIRALGLQ